MHKESTQYHKRTEYSNQEEQLLLKIIKFSENKEGILEIFESLNL